MQKREREEKKERQRTGKEGGMERDFPLCLLLVLVCCVQAIMISFA